MLGGLNYTSGKYRGFIDQPNHNKTEQNLDPYFFLKLD